MNPLSRSEMHAYDNCANLVSHYLPGVQVQAFKNLMSVLALLVRTYSIKERAYETKKEWGHVPSASKFISNIKAKDIEKFIHVSERTAYDYVHVVRFVGQLYIHINTIENQWSVSTTHSEAFPPYVCERMVTNYQHGLRLQVFRKLIRALAYLVSHYSIKERAYEKWKEEGGYVYDGFVPSLSADLVRIKAKDIEKFIHVSERTAHEYARVVRFVGALLAQIKHINDYTE